MIKKIPLPITGVALGFAALGNLLQSYSEGVRLCCGVISAVLLILYLVKMIRYPDSFREDMQNPIMARVFCTSTMALMLLAGYLKPYISVVADVIWYAAIVLHVVLMLYFTAKFILKLQMPKVFASYFIVYVGIVVASVSAPAFGATGLGTGIFWFGFAVLLALLVPVTYRYAKFCEIPPPAQPLFCIYTAPTSLCLAGYIQSVQNKSIAMIAFLAILATVLYLVVLVKLPKYLKMPFFPSYAAFTFPFVISAIAMKQTMACLANMGSPMPWLNVVVIVETVIAVVLCIYALVRYILFVTAK